MAVSYAWIAAAFALAAWQPNVAGILVAVVLLGGRQLALAILMHECAHRSLFASRRLNDLVGRWLCAAPVWNRLGDYRRHHLGHHAHTGTERDPDRGLVTPFPTSRASLARKFARDLTGLAGLRRTAALVLMDLNLLTYTASTSARWTRPDERSLAKTLASLARHTGPTVVWNLTLAGLLAAIGAAWLYVLWPIAWLTTFGLFLRVRSIAEHACTDWSSDPFRNTRTTHAGPVARLLVAPHDVNLHLEHHLLMTVPHYRLRELRELLAERGALEGAPYARGYWEVLRTATAA